MPGPFIALEDTSHYSIQRARDMGNRNAEIQAIRDCLKGGSCPMTTRKMIQAQHTYLGRSLGREDGQNCRSKLVMSALVGFWPTLITRVVRTAGRTVPFVFGVTPLYRVITGSRFNLDGEVKEERHRVGHEWIDLGVSIGTELVTIVKIVKPDALQDSCERLCDYYVGRIDDKAERDEYVKYMMKERSDRDSAIKRAWRNGDAPPEYPVSAIVAADGDLEEMDD